MIKLKLILLILCGLILFTKLNADIEIRFKINNEIVTNIDISDEKNYLIFLKPNLKILSDEELTKIAEESIIREIIKKKETDRVYKNQENSKFIEEVKKSLFRYKNVKNENEFIKLTKVNRINYKGILINGPTSIFLKIYLVLISKSHGRIIDQSVSLSKQPN